MAAIPKSRRVSECSELVNASQNSPSLKVGSRGDGVVQLQRILRDFGYQLPITFAGNSADGEFGKETESAVKSYQQKKGLTADGIAGAQTIAAMDADIVANPIFEKVTREEFSADMLSDIGKPVGSRRNYQI